MIGFGEWNIIILAVVFLILFLYTVVWISYKSLISFKSGKSEAEKELEEWNEKNY
jgi:hypothetical protein